MIKTGLIALSYIFVLAAAQNCHIDGSGHDRLRTVFSDGIKSNDLQSIYYSALNLKTLTEKEKLDTCNRLGNVHAASKLNEFEKNFYLVGSHNHLQCKNTVPAPVLSAIASALTKESATAQELYYNYFANKYVGNTVDDGTKTKIAARLYNILSSDDSLSNVGYAFNVGAELGTKASNLKKWIEITTAQADEVDGTLLQFEGGLSITALIINGILKYSKAIQTKSPLTNAQVQKFTAYYLSRRLVQQPKGASILLEVLESIAGDYKETSVCIEVLKHGLVQPDSPLLHVKLVDILNRPLKSASTLQAAVLSAADGSVISSKLSLTPKSSDNTIHQLDLTSAKLTRGLYNIELTHGASKTVHPVKVLGKVLVQNVEIGIGESDSSSPDQKHVLTQPEKLATVLSVDQQQKISLKALLVDELTKKPITVHQAFVLFRDKNSNKEIIFIAEQDASKVYKFNLDVGAHAGFFHHVSGIYSYELIVGDAMITNSFHWYLADIELKFQEKTEKLSVTNESVLRAPQPEIIHQFRQPEKRPARFVSDLFTVLTAAPLLVLFALWTKLGVNVSNFSFSFSSIGFFSCFGGILTLFALFWYQYNMFETLRLLIPLLIVTFIFGNRFLRSVARREHQKTE